MFTFLWHTMSLHVGSRVARCSCMTSPPAAEAVDWQCGSLVLSGVVVWIDHRTSVFCIGVRPAVALRRQTHSDTDQTQNAPVWRSSRLNSHHHTRHDKTVLCVSYLAWQCELALRTPHLHSLTHTITQTRVQVCIYTAMSQLVSFYMLVIGLFD